MLPGPSRVLRFRYASTGTIRAQTTRMASTLLLSTRHLEQSPNGQMRIVIDEQRTLCT